MTEITKAEYWLLDAAKTMGVPIGDLHSEEAIGTGLSRSLHGLTLSELHEASVTLTNTQRIEVARISRETLQILPPLSAREARQIYAAGGPYDYRLTARGGAIWEEHSSPNWGHFVDASYGSADGEIIAADPRLVAQYARLQHDWQHVAIVDGSAQMDELAPWQATYWKTLPRGYRLRFRTQPNITTTPPPGEVLHWFSMLERWYKSPFWNAISPYGDATILPPFYPFT